MEALALTWHLDRPVDDCLDLALATQVLPKLLRTSFCVRIPKISSSQSRQYRPEYLS